MRPSRFAAGALLLGITAWDPSASAFCRTTTSQVPPDYDPAICGCWPSGLPLYWLNACVSYDIQENASKQISYDTAATDIALAFTRWTSTTCATDDHGTGRVSIDVRDFGPVACNVVQYDNLGGPNQHVIIFRDDKWPYHDTSNTLALTTVTYDPDTGEIYDADMEINTFQYTLSTTPDVPEDGYDFLSIVTHETGHFLGMAHATDMHATMYAHYTPGSEAMRLLTEDDINGICTIYPPDGTRSVAPAASETGTVQETSCDPTPMGGFTTQCMSTGGCSSSSIPPTARTAGPQAWAGAWAFLVALAVRRKRAR
jgi:matrixin